MTIVGDEPRPVKVDEDGTLRTVPGGAELAVADQPLAFSEASQAVLRTIASLATAFGLGFCAVLGMLREHSENVLAGASASPTLGGLLQTSAAPEPTPLWVFIGLTSAIFVLSELVAAKTTNPYADAVKRQETSIEKLATKEHKLVEGREKSLAARSNIRRRIKELVRRTRIDLQVARAQQMPQQIKDNQILAPALREPEEGDETPPHIVNALGILEDDPRGEIRLVMPDDVQAMLDALVAEASGNSNGDHAGAEA